MTVNSSKAIVYIVMVVVAAAVVGVTYLILANKETDEFENAVS
jgi:hypothetical protein